LKISSNFEELGGGVDLGLRFEIVIQHNQSRGKFSQDGP
jgi:hypothetical protein